MGGGGVRREINGIYCYREFTACSSSVSSHPVAIVIKKNLGAGGLMLYREVYIVKRYRSPRPLFLTTVSSKRPL